MPTAMTFNNKAMVFGSTPKWMAVSSSDPYNPLGLPPLTLRAKWSSGYTPTVGATNTCVDPTNNVWDSTMADGNWRRLFYNDSILQANLLEVVGANTTDVTDIRQCFQDCSNLTSVSSMDLSGCTQYGPTSLFYRCTNLVSVGNLKTTGIPSTNKMFFGCYMLSSISLFDTSSVTDTSSMFYNCKSLHSVPFFDTSSVTDFGYRNTEGMFSGSAITTFPAFDVSSATSLRGMFLGCTSLTTIPANWDVSSIQDFDGTFDGCSRLVNVPTLNTSSATKMSFMFAECSSLVTAPTLTTTSVTNMNKMFYGCSSLTSVPLYPTSTVTTMEGTFALCSSLESLPLFDTSHVTRFYASAVTQSAGFCTGCTSLKTVPLLNTSSATSVVHMFSGCTSVQSGALALYQQMSSQATPPSVYQDCFTNCGASTTTGAAELAQIPTSWGGTYNPPSESGDDPVEPDIEED